MQTNAQILNLAAVLTRAGWKLAPKGGHRMTGFPWIVPRPDGRCDLVDIPAVPVLEQFDMDRIGLVLVDEKGGLIKRWGMALSSAIGSNDGSAINPSLMGLVRAAQRGQSVSALVDDWRCHATLVNGLNPPHVVMLIADAREEADAKRKAAQSERRAEALKKIGKALTMHQTLQPMTVAAAHAISAATELAAVLLWVRSVDDGPMELVACVGADRTGATVMAKLELDNSTGCAAEQAASRMKPVVVPNVHQNPATANREAKFCYLSPGGLMVWPLIIGSKLVGLLEVVAREDDSTFLESQDLFATIAEHLSLALNSALMFESAEKLATFDPLTGISNHRTMQEFLHKRVEEAKRSNGTVGAIMLDVDHFRRFNEEEGHDAGDKVLRMVAEVLKGAVRPYDLAARYGGEEFTVVMPGVSESDVLAAAERIRRGIESLKYVASNGQSRKITASLGCAVYPQHGAEPANLLKAADVALYEAKRLSRNRSALFSIESAAAASTNESKALESAVPAAVLKLVPDDHQKECRAFGMRCKPHIQKVTRELNLSANQIKTLESAAFLWPLWNGVGAASGRFSLTLADTDPVIKPVLACLNDLEERFDGHGARGLQGAQIPLISRVFAAIQALASAGDKMVLPGGRLDPDVVAMLTDSGRAA